MKFVALLLLTVHVCGLTSGEKLKSRRRNSHETSEARARWPDDFYFDPSGCPDGCGDNGVCVSGRCLCRLGYDGWTCDERLVPKSASRYHLVTEQKTWMDAQHYCKKNYQGSLVVINDQNDQKELTAFMSRKPGQLPGQTDDQCQCYLGGVTQHLGLNMTKIEVTTTAGPLAITTVATETTDSASTQKCATGGWWTAGRLTSESRKFAWWTRVGARWTKRVMTYTHWANGQPDNSSQQCVTVSPDSFVWKDSTCRTPRCFVCENRNK